MNTRIDLGERDLPDRFLNLTYYLKTYLHAVPDPPLDPATRTPVTADVLGRLFVPEIVTQETTADEFVGIPDEVRALYAAYRPTPLMRARRLERLLDTPARIYVKYEGATLSGSHKINTAIAQAYYNKRAGITKLVTETGAGQWGSALAMACRFFGLECTVFMVRVSFEQKPYRKTVMHLYGADVIASPSTVTEFGRTVLSHDPDCPGSLGIAIAEALEVIGRERDAKYALGSVLNHVLLHQSVIGLETARQMEIAGDYPDTVIACVGGGSNAAGFAAPFIADRLKGTRSPKIVLVESAACPKMTEGIYRYDFGDAAGKTPLFRMQSLGHDFVPPGIHAGGLRYHANAPLLSFLNEAHVTQAVAYPQTDVFAAAVLFARAEGIIPAPESAHAIKAAIDEAVRAKEEGQGKTIVLNCSGHGLLDLAGYESYLAGTLK